MAAEEIQVNLEKLSLDPVKKSNKALRGAPNLTQTVVRSEYHDPHTWEFTKELEANWEEINSEFEHLQQNLFHPW
jgi:hypothetical protein